MTKSLLEKIIKTLNILNAPAAAVVGVWSSSITTATIVAASFGLLVSIAEYLKLFAKDS